MVEKVPTQENKEHQKYYRQILDAELFMIWRDGELPMVATSDNEDSDAEPNTVTSFWFDSPTKVRSSRGIIIEVDASRLPQKPQAGKMRYRRYPTDLEVNDAVLRGRPVPTVKHFEAKEYYISSRLKRVDLQIYIEDISKTIFADWRKKWEQAKKEESYPGWENAWVYGIVGDRDYADFIASLFKHEFGADEINWPPNVFRQVNKDFDTSDKESEMTNEGWVRLEPGIYIEEKRMVKICNQLIEFFKWVESLPSESELEGPEPKKRSIRSL